MASVPLQALNSLCNNASRNIQEWLTELTVSSEPECIFILYAKSFLDLTEEQHLSSNHCNDQFERIHFGDSSLPAPAKPKRCIARMTSSSSGHVMTASTPVSRTSNGKHRTTVCYQYDRTKIISTKCNPTSAVIRVKSSNASASNGMDEVKLKDNLTTNEISTVKFPTVRTHSARTSFSVINRSLTPKISAKGHRYRLHRKPQKSHRSLCRQQQQKEEENETVESDQKPNDVAAMINNTDDVNLNNSHYSQAESSSLNADTDQWMRMVDGHQLVPSASEQSSSCSRGQLNSSNIDDISSLDEQLNVSQTCDDNDEEVGNVCATEQNDSQSWSLVVAPPIVKVKFRKPPKTTISIQRVTESDRKFEMAGTRNRQLLSKHRIRTSHKTGNCRQMLLDAPSSSQVIKSISNHSRYYGCDPDDDILELTGPEAIASSVFETIDSSTNSSVDSGQGSTDLNFQNCSPKDLLSCDKILPTYARIANTIDHVLRVCSTFHTVLNDEISGKWSNDLICEAKVLIVAIQCSPCATFLSAHDIATVQQIISELQSEHCSTERSVSASIFPIALLRKIIHEVLVTFARIISAHLAECTNHDRLLIIALEHLIHLMLFGDEICLVIIECGGFDSLLYFCEVPSVSNGTLRLLLRALAILCGNYRGALKLLVLNKFELIIELLFTSTIACSAEAAGVLSQLTNPNQYYVRLGNMLSRVVIRILEIVDKSKVAESLLLALAALANITVQERGTIDILYEHNAIKRFVQAHKRPKCHNAFIEEQLLTIFISLANGAYIEALIGQGAIDLLLSLLRTRGGTNVNSCKRIQIRTIQCLRTIASHGIGLKAIHEMNGYSVISKVVRDDSIPSNVKNSLWWITDQLEKKYQLESAV